MRHNPAMCAESYHPQYNIESDYNRAYILTLSSSQSLDAALLEYNWNARARPDATFRYSLFGSLRF